MAGLNVIAPGDMGYLWEAVRKSGSVENELYIGELNNKKTENILRHWPSPTETDLAGKEDVRHYRSWES